MQVQFLSPDVADRLQLPRLRVSLAAAHPARVTMAVPASRRCVLIHYRDEGRCLVEVDLGASEYAFVELAVVWRHWVVIGCGHALHFVDPQSGRTRTHDLESYFCDLYSTEDRLIASSAERVFCLDAAAQLRWRSDPIAVDGINLYKVDSGAVQGSAERDPPGGWVGFAVDLVTGRSVTPTSEISESTERRLPPRNG